VNRALRRGLRMHGRGYARPLDVTLERLEQVVQTIRRPSVHGGYESLPASIGQCRTSAPRIGSWWPTRALRCLGMRAGSARNERFAPTVAPRIGWRAADRAEVRELDVAGSRDSERRSRGRPCMVFTCPAGRAARVRDPMNGDIWSTGRTVAVSCGSRV
jgi:hypothetical protein